MNTVIDANMKLFAERLNITSSRMIQDYGLSSIEEIIETEAEKGNMKAVTFATEVFHSPEKLIKVFKLADVENKFVLLHKMDDITRKKILPLLDENDLVMGLYFYTQEALLRMLENVDIKELVVVTREAFPLEVIVSMFTEEDLAMFFQNQELQKFDVMQQLALLPPDVMQKFVEGVTGQPSEKTDIGEFLMSISNLPDDKYRDFMSSIDPDVQRQLVFQLTKEKPEYLELFPPMAYINMLSTMTKPDMVKPMIALSKDSLVRMNVNLPDDLMAIVGAQIDTHKLANFLLNNHLEVLKEAMMI